MESRMRDDHFEAVTIETGDVGRHANITNTRQIAERPIKQNVLQCILIKKRVISLNPS
jgi:hypothetical protein